MSTFTLKILWLFKKSHRQRKNIFSNVKFWNHRNELMSIDLRINFLFFFFSMQTIALSRWSDALTDEYLRTQNATISLFDKKNLLYISRGLLGLHDTPLWRAVNHCLVSHGWGRHFVLFFVHFWNSFLCGVLSFPSVLLKC